MTRHEFPSGQNSLTLTHDYATASRYAIYGVAANNSGLRGAACFVVEVNATGQRTPQSTEATSPTLVRAGLTELTILNLPFTKDIRLAMDFTDAAGLRFRAGRSRIGSGPTNITVPVVLGDAYAHNPSRVEVIRLGIEPKHGIIGPSVNRTVALKLKTLLLGVFSTAQMRVVDLTLTLTADMLNVFVAGSSTPLPVTFITANTDGTLTVPLLYRVSNSAPWQRIERIEIALTPEMLAGFVLDAAPTNLPAGTTAKWAELRPGAFTPVPDPVPPTPTPTETPVATPSATSTTPEPDPPAPTATPTPPSTQTKVFLPMIQR
ncbi:MAG: hypothetical protein HC853_09415 [Anaerolineae bacterium]|nr:hypothetical protein [Anaerolineae bacterium]